MIADQERALLLLIQEAIPLVPRPYQALAERLGSSEEEVLTLLRSLLDQGKVKRLAALPNHYALGITANAMTAWDVPDEQVDELGQMLGRQPEVTHCYRRPRHLPQWPYNLFAMVHGFDRDAVLATIERISQDVGLSEMPREVLFSKRILKKRGTRIQPDEG
jgi:DNA-binding Lrp family transcriptional regulator